MGAPSWFSEFFPWVALQGILAYVVAQHPGGLPTMCQTRLVGCVCKCTDHTYALQVAIVTGGNSGIGLETVRALLKKHATVYIAARNAETAKAAIDAFQKEPATAAGKVTFLPLDLASFRSIEAFVRAFQERESRLDLLFNSAGVIFTEVCRGCFRFWLTAPVGPCHCGRLRDPLWYQCAWPLLSYETFDPAAACFDKGIAY